MRYAFDGPRDFTASACLPRPVLSARPFACMMQEYVASNENPGGGGVMQVGGGGGDGGAASDDGAMGSRSPSFMASEAYDDAVCFRRPS